MKSEPRGADTSDLEVTNISAHGFWVLLSEKEFFVSFDQFPWFKDAPVGAILNVQLPHPGHLYWPDLDVDVDIECIEHPERFPLVWKPAPDKPPKRAK